MGLHVARGWEPGEIERNCPCLKAPCGLVDYKRADPACTEHHESQAKTIRQHHAADQCPADPAQTQTKETPMSGYARLSGEITIEPPLTWGQIRNGPNLKALEYVQETEEVETDEGSLTKVTAYAVVPRGPRPVSVERVMDDLSRLAVAFPDNELGDYLTAAADTPEDLFRLVMREGRPTRITPTIIWPQD
ncbi:DUF6205 family protein [Nocardiopsis synnemataformans]|uniref:DUF6205 family protein n=1 Tax=Nocardiopsis synnemataformans TaxID=61305 RepID=UPI003EC05684